MNMLDYVCKHGGRDKQPGLECVPSRCHHSTCPTRLQMTQRVLEAGKQVLQEKPIASTAEEGEKRVAEFRAAQAKLAPEKRIEWFFAGQPLRIQRHSSVHRRLIVKAWQVTV